MGTDQEVMQKNIIRAVADFLKKEGFDKINADLDNYEKPQ